VILFKEALCQKASDGSSFVECLNKQGVLAGIKVDEVCMQMLNSVCVQPGLKFICISITEALQHHYNRMFLNLYHNVFYVVHNFAAFALGCWTMQLSAALLWVDRRT